MPVYFVQVFQAVVQFPFIRIPYIYTEVYFRDAFENFMEILKYFKTST